VIEKNLTFLLNADLARDVTAVGDEEVRALDRGDSTEVAMNEIHT
jgi:hypothetical protein